MNVSETNGATAHAYGHAKAVERGKGGSAADGSPEILNGSQATGGESTNESAPSEGTEEVRRGVLRLLIAGHFKGVANVRLRINFHDELAAAGYVEMGSAASSGMSPLLETVRAFVEELAESGLLTEEELADVMALAEEFATAAESGVTQFLGAAQQDTGAVVSDVQSAMDAFLAALTERLGLNVEEAPGEEPPAEEPIPDEPVEPTDEVVDVLAELRARVEALAESLAAGLSGLDGAINAGNILPPLTPPDNNGAAFAKFLAIYEALQSAPAEEA